MRDAAIDSFRQSGRGAARSRTAGAPPLDGLLDEGRAIRAPREGTRPGKPSSAAIAAQRLGGGRNVAMSVAQARRRAAPGLLTRLRGRLPRFRPLRALTIVAFLVALVGIVANAMVFQRGRHPAPLLGAGASADGQPEAARQPTAAPAPATAERTGSVAPASPVAAAEPAPAPVPARPAPAPVRHAVVAKPRHQDGIGGLLESKAAPAAHARAEHVRPGHAPAAGTIRTKPAAGEHKAEAKAEAKTLTKPKAPSANAVARTADQRAAAEAADILTRPAPAHAVKGGAPHPRPHAKAATPEVRGEVTAKKAAAAE